MNSPPEVRRRTIVTILKRADVALIILLVVAMIGLILWNSFREDKQQAAVNSVARQYATQQIPLNGFVETSQGLTVGLANSVVINGSLKVGDGLIITPSVQPNTPKAGQLYFDQNTNQLAYFNGTRYVSLTEQGVVVQNVGGATGAITLGGGLSVVGNQLNVNFPETAQAPVGVSSLGGATGALSVGNGLRLVNGDLQNAGVVSLTPGSGNLVVGTDGNGNLTITDTTGPAGTGTVTSGGGTPGRIAKFTGVQNLEDSLLSETGTTVTVNGDLSATGSLVLGTPLAVTSGGTGASVLTTNGVIIGQGAGPLTAVTAPGDGLCLMSTTGAPAFQMCPVNGGSGVASLNGLTGGLNIANASGTGSTVTIDDASTAAKGLARFNASNFSVAAGLVNTIQDIGTGATPTFAGVNTNNINPSGALTIGSLSQSFTVQGTAASVFTVSGNGFNTNVGFTGTATGNVNYNFDRAATPGTYAICTTAANCAGIGGGVSTAGGTTNRLSKFTGAQAVGDSVISDDGSTITVNGTANLVVQGGTGTFGTLTQAGSVVLHDGSGDTATLVISGLAANRTYTIPDAGGPATFCLSSGNCVGGGGGGAPNNAEYLVANLSGTLTNERALGAGSNVSLNDGGANGTLTIATVNNPSFTTSVTTPILQSSGALTLSSAAGQQVIVDAGTTIQLQDDTNVTGNFDVSGGLNAGTGNAFAVSNAGAITAATGIVSSGSITFSGLNCTGNANGGALTTNGSGQLVCSDDDGGSGSAISGSGSTGTVALFSGTQTISNSIITQSGASITIAGDLSLNDELTVANGGTGVGSFTTNGLVYGNGTGALQVTAAGTGGQVMVANASGVPTFMTVGGDLAVSNTGVATIQANSIALGTDTVGDYVQNLGTLTGLSTSGNTGEGSTPTLSVNYGSIASTAVQGNVTLTCPAGSGNLTGGGGTITLGAGGSCGGISTVNNPTFSTSVTSPSFILTGAGNNGTIQVANLGQGTVYTLPDPGGAAATICLSTGNCTTAGTAGGDLTGTYPNPTIAKLQNTNLTITSPTAGHILVYNGTTSAWENRAITGDIAISEAGNATVQANSVALGTDTTGNYVIGLTAGNGINVTGSAGEGWSPTVSVAYGSSANTAVEGNTSLTVTAGTNLTGGGAITLGTGGTVTLNVASSPTFSGTLTVQGATASIGTTSVAGSVVLSDGSSNTGSIQTAALGQNTAYTLPDPGGASATICLNTGNCAGSGSGVTTVGGTTNRVSKFTGSQSLGDSSISDNGTTVTINGTANLVVQGGTSTLGTTSQSGTLALSDGSSNTVSIVVSALAADRTYTLPDAGGPASFCLSTGNCLGGGGGGAPNSAAYLLASLDGTLTNDRALTSGSNISFTDAGANGNFTVATVQNPTFTTSVTTPILQSSGALAISSAAGQTVAIDAGTTIELQDSTNVTGSLDVSVALNVGTGNAFAVSNAGAITAATGIVSSGNITFSGLNCTGNANGGALTTNGSGQLVCSDDDGGSGSAISGTGTSGTVALFTGSQTVGNSIVTQAGTTITIAGDLVLSTDLTVANGGTGAGSFTTNGVLYGNGTGALQVTAAGTGGQVMVANGSGIPTFVSFSGDVAVSATGATTIQANSVALGTDTTGDYVQNLGTLTGLTTGGNSGEGSTPSLSVTYGSGANTAVQGNVTLTCPSGTGNLTGGGTSITLGTGGSCGNISTVNNPTFSTSVTSPSFILTGAGSNGTIQIANLGQATAYTLPDPGSGAATICLNTGNCNTAGTAGGDLTGTYPNPTIAKLQNTNLTITSPVAGHVLIYNGTSSRWENRILSSDVTISETGVATIQANSVALGTDTTGNYVLGLTAGNGINITGAAGEGWSPTVTVLYGATANTAVEGNTSITLTAGTNLTGGGAITLGSGGTVTLNVASSPTFSGTLTVQGASATIGGAAQQGSLILNDGSSNTGTIQTAALGQNTTYTLPDPAGASATICLNTGNCTAAGTAGGDLTGTYPNPTIAKLQNTNLTITTPTAGQVLIYNGTSTRWENRSISSDIVISETGVATIQANSVALGTDTTGNYAAGVTAGNGINISGTPGEGWSPTINTTYGATANTAVEGNTSLTVTAGTNLTGGGAITLGSGGTVTLNVASSPTFSGSLTVQGTGANTFSGQLVVSNVATDITTGTNEDLTVLANGTGQIVLNDTVQVATLGSASNSTYLCRNGSNQIATCSTGLSGSAFVQGGNSFGAAGTLGTGDAFDLNIITGGSTRLTIESDGSQLTVASNTDFVLQGATAYISNTQGQTGSEAFGLTAAVTGGNALAVGNTASAAAGGVAVGQGAVAVADAVSVGNAAGASAGAFGGPVSIGDEANSGSWGVAIGRAATTTGNWGVAIGEATTAAQNATAVGQGANAGTNGVALGADAITGGNNRIVIGSAATATADNQLVVGGSTTNASYVSDAYFGSGVTDATPQAFTLNGTGGSGANIVGANINIAGGRGTGTGAGGSINMRIAAPSGSSSTLNNLATVMSLNGSTGAMLLQNATNSATAMQVQNAAGTEVMFKIDTTARSGSGGNLVKIGNSTGTDADITILQLDSTTTNPATNLAALNGGLFYNSVTGRVNVIEGGVVKAVCNAVDLACGSASAPRLDQVIAATTNATIANAANNIVWNWQLTAAEVGMVLGETAASTGGGTNNQFILQSSTLSGSTASPLSVVSNSVDAADIIFNLNNAGDLQIQDAGTAFLVMSDTGAFNYTLDATDDPTFTITNSGDGEVAIYQSTGNFRVFDDGTLSFAVDSVGDVYLGKADGGRFVFVGDGTSGTTPNLFFLDQKGNTGDPGFVEGAMYYSAWTQKFRCAQGAGWTDCIGSAATALQQAPTSTAVNTITPTLASVVGLTVNGTSGTTAQALVVNQSQTADAMSVNSTNTSGTQTNGLLISRNGVGGTTTNGIQIAQSNGTLTNGIALSGTIAVDILRTGGTMTLQGSNAISAGAVGTAMQMTTGNGGTTVSTTAGAGGAWGLNTGTGGAASGSGTGGAGGNVTLTAGSGGNSSTGNAGAGGIITLQPGTGGVGGAADGAMGRVQVGSSTTNAVAHVFSLDSFNGANESTFNTGQNVNGSMYYNTNINKFRCYQNGGWTDCISSVGAGGLAKNAMDTSSSAVTASNYLYAFTNSSSAIASGVLSLTNGTNTGSTLRVVSSGNAGSGNALISAQLSNAAISGNLMDLRSGVSGSETSKFVVTAAGNVGINTGATAPTSDIQFGNGASRTIDVQGTSGLTAGRSLTIRGGNSANDVAGGSAILSGGNSFGASFTAAGSLTNTTDDNGGDATVQGGNGGASITVGGSDANVVSGDTNGGGIVIQSVGGSGVGTNGNVRVRTAVNTYNGFEVVNSSNSELLTVDTANNRVYIGDTTIDTTGTILVLDTKTSAGDPTGVNGAMYYNSNMGIMRCYIDSAWQHCNDTRMAMSYNIQEEFIGAAPGSNEGQGWTCGGGTIGMGTTHNWNCNGTGTDSTVASVAADTYQRPGQLQLTTGTASTNSIITYLGGGNGGDPFLIGGGESFETAINIPTLSDGTNRYMIRLGVCDADETHNTDCTNGVYFEYDSATSANWRYNTANGGTRTKTSSTKIVATGWTNLKWVATTSGNINFYVKNSGDSAYVLIGNITGNIPTANATRIMYKLDKFLGTTARTFKIDYMDYWNDFTARR